MHIFKRDILNNKIYSIRVFLKVTSVFIIDKISSKMAEVDAAVNEVLVKMWKRKARWFIAKGEDNYARFVLEAEGPRTDTFEELRAAVEPIKSQSRFIGMDYEWTAADGRKISKTVVIAYVPDDCESKPEKMAYSSGLDNFKGKMSKPINDARTVNSFEDLTAENIQSWFKE